MSARRFDDAPAWPAKGDRRILSTDVSRVDGPAKATGAARYSHDVRLPGMVWARFVTCPVPRATVTLDLDAALAVPGVVDAVACSSGTTLYLGEPVAAVAAETSEAAAEGARVLARTMGLEELDWVVTREQAREDGAPAVSSRGNVTRERTSDDGDPDGAWAACDAVVEGDYTVQVQHHACLETHGMVVDYRGGDEATIYGSVQGTFALVEDSPELLGLERGQVTGDVQHMGGGFGSKFGTGIEGRVACELSKRLGRPVHLMMDRKTEFLAAGNRSGNFARLKLGGTRDGKLVAMECDSDRLGGLSGGSYPGMPYIYAVPNSRSTLRSVHTNTDGNRAMRAPGHPQASFGMEGILDELAYALGVDPVELRLANLPEAGGATWRRHLEACAREIGWYDHPHRTAPGTALVEGGRESVEGIGFGLSVWGGGGHPSCEVTTTVDRDGKLTASVGVQDIGTGCRTLVAMITAEEFGLPVEAVMARIGNTAYGPGVMSGGSVTTASLAPAVKDAAFKLRHALLDLAADALGVAADDLYFDAGAARSRSNPGLRLEWKNLAALGGSAGVTAHGTFRRELQDSGVQGAQAARVRVDLVTGRVDVLKMVCMQNCGLPLNRKTLRSQIQGAMVQGLSFALFEERLIDPWIGVALNPNFETYKLANSPTIPEMVVILDEEDDRGVIGVGEPPAIPPHSAIAGAVHNACGVRLRSMPLTPDKVLLALEERRAQLRSGR